MSIQVDFENALRQAARLQQLLDQHRLTATWCDATARDARAGGIMWQGRARTA